MPVPTGGGGVGGEGAAGGGVPGFGGGLPAGGLGGVAGGGVLPVGGVPAGADATESEPPQPDRTAPAAAVNSRRRRRRSIGRGFAASVRCFFMDRNRSGKAGHSSARRTRRKCTGGRQLAAWSAAGRCDIGRGLLRPRAADICHAIRATHRYRGLSSPPAGQPCPHVGNPDRHGASQARLGGTLASLRPISAAVAAIPGGWSRVPRGRPLGHHRMRPQ